MDSRKIVAKNALWVFLSQVITNAVAFATTPFLARVLGSSDYGRWWVACSVSSLAALFMDFGLEGYVSIATARDRSRAPELLGTSVLLRWALAALVALPLWGALLLLKYDAQMQIIVFALYFSCVLSQTGVGGMAVLRGLERMGWPAAARVGSDALSAALLVAALWGGARLTGVSFVSLVSGAIGLVVSLYIVRRARLWPPRVNLQITGELLRGGMPFLLWTGILLVQPALESVLLSRLASNEVAGWYGASYKLLGVLVFPASILGAAYMPSMARLQVSDSHGFREMVLEALRLALLFGAPVAVGTYLFADHGVRLVYGSRGFSASADNLRVLSAHLFIIGFNIPLGTVLLVSRRQLQWALSKGAFVLLGAAVSYVLIPYFEVRTGNGGLAVAWVTVVSELGMLIAALLLLPRRLLEGRALIDLGRALLASAAMVLMARLLSGAPALLAMAAAVIAYGAALFAVGGIGTRDFALLRDTVRAAVGRVW